LFEPGRQRLLVQCHQAGDVRLRVTDHHALADEPVGAESVLEHGRRDVLAGGRDDDLLLAAGDAQEAVGVELAEVAAVEPAVGERLGRGSRVVVVAGEDVWALDEHLAVLGDAHCRSVERTADRADLDVSGGVHRRGGRRLGQPVALQHREPDAAVEVSEPQPERGPAGDRPLHLAAERRPQLDVDELVERRVLRAEPEARAAMVERLAVGDGGLGRGVEDLALAGRLCLLLRGVVDLLEDARHREDERRLEARQVCEQFLDVGCVPKLSAGHHDTDLDNPGEHVCQRQEQQRGRFLVLEHAAQRRVSVLETHHVAQLEQEVPVGELAALGPTGRP
jgi:hypothetical protein